MKCIMLLALCALIIPGPALAQTVERFTGFTRTLDKTIDLDILKIRFSATPNVWMTSSGKHRADSVTGYSRVAADSGAIMEASVKVGDMAEARFVPLKATINSRYSRRFSSDCNASKIRIAVVGLDRVSRDDPERGCRAEGFTSTSVDVPIMRFNEVVVEGFDRDVLAIAGLVAHATIRVQGTVGGAASSGWYYYPLNNGSAATGDYAFAGLKGRFRASVEAGFVYENATKIRACLGTDAGDLCLSPDSVSVGGVLDVLDIELGFGADVDKQLNMNQTTQYVATVAPEYRIRSTLLGKVCAGASLTGRAKQNLEVFGVDLGRPELAVSGSHCEPLNKTLFDSGPPLPPPYVGVGTFPQYW